jgi:hypothetical protein
LFIRTQLISEAPVLREALTSGGHAV